MIGGEARAWQRVAEVLRGNLDLSDPRVRQDVVRDLAYLDERAYRAQMAGVRSDAETWDELLEQVEIREPEAVTRG